MRWPLTFYVSGRPLKKGQAGVTIGPLIFIRTGYEADAGLYEHELTHVKQSAAFAFAGAILGMVAAGRFPQFQNWPVLWGALAGLAAAGLAYCFVRRYRLFAEAQAYARQMRYPDKDGVNMTLDTGAYRLALPTYRLGLSVSEAKAAILKY